MSSPPAKKEKKPRGIRKPLSCTECRRRKLKCDRNLPCSTCIKREVADNCAYRELDVRDPKKSKGGVIKDLRPSVNNSGYEDIQTHILQIESLLQEVRSKSGGGLDGTNNIIIAPQDDLSTFTPLNGPVSVSSIGSVSTDSSSFDRRPSETSYGSDQSPSLQDSTNTLRPTATANSDHTNATNKTTMTSSTVSSITAGDTLTAMAGIRIERGESAIDSSFQGKNGGEIISSSSAVTIPSVQLTALVEQVNLLKNALILNGGSNSIDNNLNSHSNNNGHNQSLNGDTTSPLAAMSTTSSAMSTSAPPPNNAWFQLQGHGFPFLLNNSSPSSSTILDDLLNRVPPIPICDYLVQEYLLVCSNVFHVMYSPYIEERYQNFRQDLETQPNPRPSLANLGLLFAIFDSAVAYLGDDDKGLIELCRRYDFYPNDPVYAMSGRFRSSALQCLVADNFLLSHSILTVQTLLVILDTSLHKDADDGPCFPIFGLVISMASTLGCNTDLEEGSPYLKSGGISVIEREERHRCWAGILLLDNLSTCLFGRPSMAVSLSSPGCLPMNTNDFNLKMGNYEPIINNSELTHMSFMLSKVKIGSVFADVYSRMRHKRPFTYEEVLGIDHICKASKDEWDRPYKSNRGYTQLSEVKYDILHNLLDQNLLLLHRPFFNIHEESRIKCIKLATDIIYRLKRFCDDPLYLPFSIYTRGLGIFYCFHSSVVLALAVAQEIVARRDPFKIFQDFDLGLNIIQQQISFSKVAERSSTVLTKFR